jgi:hypothetical protein
VEGPVSALRRFRETRRASFHNINGPIVGGFRQVLEVVELPLDEDFEPAV